MSITRRKAITFAAASTAGASLPPILAYAQVAGAGLSGWPNKPVRVVVPYPPGGATDILARLLATELGKTFGQQFVVDNRAGASGAIGTDLVAKSPPDGYTLLVGTNASHATNVATIRGLSYNPVTDFQQIGILASTPLLVAVHPSLPVNNMKELVELAQRQGELPYGMLGPGSASNVFGEYLRKKVGVKIFGIPYKGSAPMALDLAGGVVKLGFADPNLLAPLHKAGKVKIIATASLKRSANLPEISTVIEQGIPDIDFSSWFVFAAPAKTPAPIVNALSKDVQRIMALPATRERVAGIGCDPMDLDAKRAQTFVENEVLRWKSLVRAAGVESQGAGS